MAGVDNGRKVPVFFHFLPYFFATDGRCKSASLRLLQINLLFGAIILVILCNFVPKSVRMPLRCAVTR